MTQPAMPPLTDPGNALLSTNVQTNMVIGLVPTEDGGVCGLLTIRNQSTTLTVPVRDRAEAQGWVDALTVLRDAFSESGLTVVRRPGLVAGMAGQHL